MKKSAVALLLVMTGFVVVRYPPLPGCDGRKTAIRDPGTGFFVTQHDCTRSYIVRFT